MQSWHRLSRLQRTMVLSVLVLCLLCSAYVLPLWFEDLEDTSAEMGRLAGRQKSLHGPAQHMSLEEEEKLGAPIPKPGVLSEVEGRAQKRLEDMVVSSACLFFYSCSDLFILFLYLVIKGESMCVCHCVSVGPVVYSCSDLFILFLYL